MALVPRTCMVIILPSTPGTDTVVIKMTGDEGEVMETWTFPWTRFPDLSLISSQITRRVIKELAKCPRPES